VPRSKSRDDSGDTFKHAVQVWEHLLDLEGQLMFAVGGDAAFEPEFNHELCSAIEDLIMHSLDGVGELAPRARHARLNLIWKDFVAPYRLPKVITLPASPVSPEPAPPKSADHV
jgi:hypothetical protein